MFGQSPLAYVLVDVFDTEFSFDLPVSRIPDLVLQKFLVTHGEPLKKAIGSQIRTPFKKVLSVSPNLNLKICSKCSIPARNVGHCEGSQLISSFS